MAGLGSFIAGAVGGYQDGANWKEGRLDRKRKREMEDERFKREKSDWAWQDENRQWNREDRQYTVSERNREIKRRDEEESFFKGLVDNPDGAAPADAGSTAQTEAPPPPRRAISGPSTARAAPDAPALPSEPAPPAGVDTMGPPRRRVIRADAAPPPPSTSGVFTQRAAQLGASPQLRNLAAAADVAQTALANPELPPDKRQQADEAVQAATMALDEAARARAGSAAVPRDPTPPTAGGAPEALYPGGATPAEMAQRQAPPQVSPMRQRYPDKQFPPGYLPEDQPRQPVAPTSADAPVSLPSNQPRTIRAPGVREAGARAMMGNTDRVPPLMRPGLADEIVSANRRNAAAPLAENRQYSALQPPALDNPVPATKLPAVTPTTDQGTPQPSLESATKTTPRTIKANGEPKEPTKAEGKRMQQSFIEDYAKNQVPKIVKFYLGRGEMDKAEAYQKWADDTLVKEAMKDWASAVHAATIGDDEGFIDGIVGAYNAKGYFDDGFEIVREASGIQRDEATGAITGAQVTFKDSQTGKVFTQEFSGSDDLYRLGVDMLSPEQVFENGWNKVQKADDLRFAVAQALAKQGVGQAVAPDDVMKAMKTLGEANLDFEQLPIEEQIAQAVEIIRRFGGRLPEGVAVSNPADVPVATRPKG